MSILCDTPALVQYGVHVLAAAPRLYIDCEGDNLGCEGGRLSLVSIGTPDAGYIFLFDVLALSTDELQPIIDILADTNILKVVWDGRMDSIEFLREFGISLGRVLDLQIVDLVSRQWRVGESAESRMERPSDPLHRVRHLDTFGIHGLGGLKGALQEHGIYGTEKTQAKKSNVDHTQWLTRPLPLQYTAYAAEDIWILSKVFEVFHARAYFRSLELEIQSQRYVNMHRGVPPQSGDIYRSSNILPMEIIEAPVARNSSRVCEGCHRVLGDACFFFRAHGYALVHTMHSHCKVCYILTQRMIIKATLRVKHRPRGNTHRQERWTAQEPPQVENVAFRDALPKDPETCEKELEAVLKRVSAA